MYTKKRGKKKEVPGRYQDLRIMKEIIINKNEAGQRFDKLLKKYLTEASTGFIYKMLRKKNIKLNGNKATGNEILSLGDKITIFFSDETLGKMTGNNINDFKKSESQGTAIRPAGFDSYKKAYGTLQNITIVYEDNHILLLNKPRGVLSQKAKADDISVNEWLIGYLLEKGELTLKQMETFKPSICNRLDRNTSGLMICSKSFPGSRTMNLLIKERKIRKFYRTFIKGSLLHPLHLKGYMIKDNNSNKVFVYDKYVENSSFMETRVVPLNHSREMTYVEVELITGKTHQIRAHLSYMDYPLLGDEKYGDKTFNNNFKAYLPGMGQMLHSYRILLPEIWDENKNSDKINFDVDALKKLAGKEFKAEEPTYFDKLKIGIFPLY